MPTITKEQIIKILDDITQPEESWSFKQDKIYRINTNDIKDEYEIPTLEN